MSMTLILVIVLTSKRLRQGYRYHKLRKAFTKFYERHFDLVSKFNVGLKHFFCKVFLNVNFMATWCIISRRSLFVIKRLVIT